MKKWILLPLCLLAGALSASAQIFWVENFESGSSSGLQVGSYTGPNGAWSNNILGSEGSSYNEWYVSCAEQGYTTGVCGNTCSAGGAGLGASLHLGANSSIGGDAGATYDAGGLCTIGICVSTDRRAESPTINCTGKTGITLSFYYIENGDTTNDNGTVWYYDGSTWDSLFDTYKTPVCSSGQGQWQHFAVALPASANNNPNVKIGFKWINNDDGTGTDPSFAVDSVSLSTSGTTTATVASFTVSDTVTCQDSCLMFYSTSTGPTDSVVWSIHGTGITRSGVHSDTLTACFSLPGYYNATLYTYHGGVSDSATHTVHINAAPHPAIFRSGSLLTVTGPYTGYQWYKNDTAIAGATTSTYTFTGYGSYTVIADSNGCQAMSAAFLYNVGVAEISATGTSYSISSQAGSDGFTLYATTAPEDDLLVYAYDATGRLLLQDVWPAGVAKKQFSISNIPDGLYIIRLGNSNNSAVLKWMKR